MEIKCIKVDILSQKERKLLPQETQQLCRVAGQMNWVSTQTRTDMAYAASAVSSSIKDATVRDLIRANKFIKMLKSKDAVLLFPNIDGISKAILISFHDESFAKLKCDSSQGGLLVILEGSDRRYMLLA